jgi:hypothetical protein
MAAAFLSTAAVVVVPVVAFLVSLLATIAHRRRHR